MEKLRSFGADSAYVLPFSEARSRRGVTNTNSGVAVGLFRGRSDSTIVIGGHIDSAGREIPGANDDASGTATMLELARVWSTRPRRYTMLFVAFSGEEQGLIGSKYFVEHYPKIDHVALMLQIDMVGSEDDLILFLETQKHEAPRWLVEDAFAFERTLGFQMLRYPTHFFSLNQALGGAGSDHMPFLDKGIPAMDFTAGVNNSPIHTPEDKFEFISKTVMDKSGRLIDSMLQKYQGQGIPAARQGDYVLWQALGGRLFIPSWLVSATSGVAVLLGIWAFFFSRKRRLSVERTERVRFSGFKLFAFIILIAGAAQAGEAAMQAIKGLRYPWLVHVDKYLWLAGLCTLAGIWVALQLTRRWRFSPDPYVYSKRAVLLLLLFVFLLAAASLRLAVYPALTLLLLSLAIFVPSPLVKALLAILAPLPMFRLMFMEVLPFLFRNAIASGFGILNFASALLYTAALTAVLVLWFMPAIFTYAYAVVTVGPLKDALKTVRAPAVGLLLLLGVVGYGGYLFSFPAYNDMWRAMIHVDATFDANTGESSLKLVGNEY
ncbi:MAG: Zn-dependent exopeptidase M28, partial [Calditrichaeota bacterium]